MASNNVINTELVESIAHGLKFISRLMPENIFYVDVRKKECTNIIKSIFFKYIKYFNLLFLSGHELPQVFQWLFFTPFDYTICQKSHNFMKTRISDTKQA